MIVALAKTREPVQYTSEQRAALIVDNYERVFSFTHRFHRSCPPHIDVDDLKDIAQIKVVHIAERYQGVSEDFYKFAVSCVKNDFFRYLRREKFRQAMPGEKRRLWYDHHGRPEVVLEDNGCPTLDVVVNAPEPALDVHEELAKWLPKIPEPYRTVFVLRERDELSYPEIAVRLSIPMGTVMSRLSRARTVIDEILSRE
ncbi:MAG: sigma-70 family RNA polymerase sigma factor [Nanoarchaeota archaeon]|nr:sigma-70 family RNA polymerase sigma factor [Nanoarchaeota archaeon]